LLLRCRAPSPHLVVLIFKDDSSWRLRFVAAAGKRVGCMSELMASESGSRGEARRKKSTKQRLGNLHMVTLDGSDRKDYIESSLIFYK